jgi:hypothetical protein
MPLYDSKVIGRFWAKVDKNGPVPTHRPDLGPCWLWTAAVMKNGYGVFAAPEEGLSSPMRLAHRVSWQIANGKLPADSTLDHLCHDKETCENWRLCPHRRCVNPTHTEPVSRGENTMRGGSPFAQNARKECCSSGHELTTENVYIEKATGYRKCRTCHRERMFRAYRDSIHSS